MDDALESARTPRILQNLESAGWTSEGAVGMVVCRLVRRHTTEGSIHVILAWPSTVGGPFYVTTGASFVCEYCGRSCSRTRLTRVVPGRASSSHGALLASLRGPLGECGDQAAPERAAAIDPVKGDAALALSGLLSRWWQS
jgi:hypothetical protein